MKNRVVKKVEKRMLVDKVCELLKENKEMKEKLEQNDLRGQS